MFPFECLDICCLVLAAPARPDKDFPGSCLVDSREVFRESAAQAKVSAVELRSPSH